MKTIRFIGLLTVFVLLTAYSVFAADIDKRFVKHAENGQIALYIDESSLEIKVENKSTGYVWSSGREANDEERLNTSWRNRVNSGVTVDYYDKTQKKAGVATILGDEARVSFSKQGERIIASVYFDALELGFDVTLELNGGTLSAGIENNTLKENNFLIRAITLFPFFGSSTAAEFDKDGYMFIPDGSGALIEYGKREITVSNPYKNKVYGGNLSIGESSYGNNILIPVFGMVNGINKNAFYAEAEKGSAYAEIYAYTPGIILDYNWAGFTFYYRQNYFQQTGKDGSGFSTIEENRAEYDILVSYTFLGGNDATYTGIAMSYKDKLISTGALTGKAGTTNPLHLDIVGAEVKKSFLWTGTGIYTTASDMQSILEDLVSEGIAPAVSYIGYYDGGYSKLPLHKTNLNGKLGSFDRLTDYARANGIALYYAASYMETHYNASGVSRSNDFIRMVDSKIFRQEYNINDQLYFETSFLRLSAMQNVIKKDFAYFVKKQMDVAVIDAGSLLYTDYAGGASREQAKDSLSSMFGGTDVKTSFYAPNSYMWAQTDKFFDIYMSSTGYMIFTQDVPFLQILLSGCIDSYAPALNHAGDPTAEILKLIEYGVYPSYHVTEHSPIDLLNTPLNFIFSSEYRLWKGKITETTRLVSSILSPVSGARIIGHSFDKAANTAVTTYDNGMQVLVNYSDKTQTISDNSVAAKSAIVCEVKN